MFRRDVIKLLMVGFSALFLPIPSEETASANQEEDINVKRKKFVDEYFPLFCEYRNKQHDPKFKVLAQRFVDIINTDVVVGYILILGLIEKERETGVNNHEQYFSPWVNAINGIQPKITQGMLHKLSGLDEEEKYQMYRRPGQYCLPQFKEAFQRRGTRS